MRNKSIILVCFFVSTLGTFGQNRSKLYAEAIDLILEDEYEEANQLISVIMSSDSAKYQSLAFVLKGIMFDRQERFDQVIHSYNQAIRLFPYNSNTYALKADFFFFHDKPDSALINYRHAINYVNKKHSNAYKSDLFLNSGRALIEMGEYQHAIEAFEQSIRLDSSIHETRYQLAYALMLMGKNEEAIVKSNEALQMEPGDMRTVFVKATSLLYNNEFEQAEELAMTMLVDFTEHYSAHLVLSEVYSRTSRLDLAVKSLEKCVQIQPESLIALNNLAFIRMGQGEYRKAIEHFDRCIKLDPEIAIPYNNKAWCLYQLGLHQEALTNVDKSLKLDAENSWAYANRALIYEALGMTSRACTDVSKAKSLDYPEMENLKSLQLKCQ